MSLTPEDIKDLRRLLSEATAGTWVDMGDTEPWPGTVIATTGPDGGVTQVCIDPEADDRPADRAWIAAIHNAAPALLTAADDLAALRLEHESWGAIIDGLRASLAAVTRERDEARATVTACQDKNRFLLDTVVAQHQADVAEARRERDILRAVNADAWAEVKALLDDRDVALAFRESAALSERDELRAQLDNAAIRERTKVVMLVASLGAAYLSRHGGGGDYCRALADVANLIDLTTPDPDALAGGKS